MIAFLCAMAAAAPAWAQESNVTEARAAFDRGVEALDHQRFAEAAAAFEESLSIRQSATALYNLALAYRGLGRYRDAADALERFLGSPPATATAGELAATRAEIERLRASLARVHLHGAPAHATIRVDGVTTAPVDGTLVVDPGRHHLEISAEGFISEQPDVVLNAGATVTLETMLVPLRREARLRVEPSVASATVSIDNMPAGSGTTERMVGFGAHVVSVTAPGFEPASRTISVGEPGTVRVDVVLAHRTAPTHPGWLLPAGIGAGVLVIAGVVVAAVAASSGTTAPIAGTWGLAQEQ